MKKNSRWHRWHLCPGSMAAAVMGSTSTGTSTRPKRGFTPIVSPSQLHFPATTFQRPHHENILSHNWSDPKTSVCIALLSFTTALWYFLMKLASGRFSSNSTSANKSGITNSGRCCEKTFESGCCYNIGRGGKEKDILVIMAIKRFLPKGQVVSFISNSGPTHPPRGV